MQQRNSQRSENATQKTHNMASSRPVTAPSNELKGGLRKCWSSTIHYSPQYQCLIPSITPVAIATDKTELDHNENWFTRAEGCQLLMMAFYAR